MKPTGNASEHPASTCKPSTENKHIHGLRRFFLSTVRFVILAGSLMLTSSYQSQKNELTLLEKEFNVPAFSGHLENFFRMPSDNGSLEEIYQSLSAMPLVKEFYSGMQFRPVWTYGTQENDQASALLNLLEHAEKYGLSPSLFPVQEIRRELDRMKNLQHRMSYMESRVNAELLLSDACLKFMVYLSKGYHVFDSSLFSIPGISLIPDLLRKAFISQDFEMQILSVQPDKPEYRDLQMALESFLSGTKRSNIPVHLPDPAMDSAGFWNAARDILISQGYRMPGTSQPAIMEALKKFQYYHGLEPDGKPGKNTCQALTQNTADKYRQVALNLDRIRKENIEAERFISVNIPSYLLKVYKQNQEVGKVKVIVGSVSTPTPLLTGKIERIITNPDWQVPRSITVKEMLPRLRSDSNYLKRNKLRLLDENRNQVSYQAVDWNNISAETFDYRIRQDAGGGNALGRIKFIFPNPYSVYLHDTPGKQSFTRESRALSHGCVRVQDPGLLADYLVREFSPQYQGQDISGMMEKGIRREIVLEQPVDLYIRYLTCEADADNKIFFYNDVYGMDKEELKNLEFLQ